MSGLFITYAIAMGAESPTLGSYRRLADTCDQAAVGQTVRDVAILCGAKISEDQSAAGVVLSITIDTWHTTFASFRAALSSRLEAIGVEHAPLDQALCRIAQHEYLARSRRNVGPYVGSLPPSRGLRNVRLDITFFLAANGHTIDPKGRLVAEPITAEVEPTEAEMEARFAQATIELEAINAKLSGQAEKLAHLAFEEADPCILTSRILSVLIETYQQGERDAMADFERKLNTLLAKKAAAASQGGSA